MKVYLVVGSDYDGSSIDEMFDNELEAKKRAEFKNKYKTPWDVYDTYYVVEREVLSVADTNVDEDNLCVKISGYIELKN